MKGVETRAPRSDGGSDNDDDDDDDDVLASLRGVFSAPFQRVDQSDVAAATAEGAVGAYDAKVRRPCSVDHDRDSRGVGSFLGPLSRDRGKRNPSSSV